VEPGWRKGATQGHSGTHMVHAALRQVLGPNAVQAGSLNRPGYLRFDFNWQGPLTDEQRTEIEEVTNQAVQADYEVHTFIEQLEKAKAMGAMAMFGEAYPDEVRVVTFQRPIATVFVGNPTIADATVIDPYHAFLLGKTFGTTNLIALGPQSQTVANQQITVVNRGGGLVTLNKGAAQFSYACTRSHCDASPLPGDQTQYFNDVNGSVNSHQDQAVKSANVAAAQH